MGAVIISFFAFVAFSAVAFAIRSWVKAAKQAHIAASLNFMLKQQSLKLVNLNKRLTKQEQAKMETSMKEASYDMLRPYACARTHITYEEQIGKGSMADVYIGFCRAEMRVLKSSLTEVMSRLR